MTPRGNTQFRFRFSLVLFLVFLLTSPKQASSAGNSCATAAALASNGGAFNQFVYNLAHCVKVAKKTYIEIQGIIKQLPEVIDKLLPVTPSGGLVVLSMYFVYNSFLLYDEAKNLGINAKFYRDKLEAFEKDIKPYKDFIDTEVIPQWEKGNTANLEKITDKLLEMFGRHAAEFQEVAQAIRQNITTGGSSQRWSTFYAAGLAFLCLGSHTVPPFGVVSIPVCAAAIGNAGLRWWSYSSDTLPELEKLEKHATTMIQEILSYRSKLYLAEMKAELRSISD